MEAFPCPQCGTRHWPRQPCPAAPSVPETDTAKIARAANNDRLRKLAKAADRIAAAEAPEKNSKEGEIDWSQCPLCAERRRKEEARMAKQVAANKRYREKRGK